MQYFIVDAFTDDLFKGNQAGVCVLDSWLDDDILQNIASENNLAETAFFVKRPDIYELRWFTPEFEMDLCGHATLATAFIILSFFDKNADVLSFSTQSGILTVTKKGELLEMDFPSRMPVETAIDPVAQKSIDAPIKEAFKSRDLLLLVESEEQVRNLKINGEHIKTMTDCFGFIVTARSSHEDYDFVSRYFAPNAGIVEDPVTGSSHSTLIPFWADRLNKSKLVAKQLSQRGGTLYCENCGDRVKIGGKAKLYLEGKVHIK